MNNIVRAKCDQYLRDDIDHFFNPKYKNIEPWHVEQQQSLFNLINMQSLWGSPCFTRGSGSFITLAAMEKDLTEFATKSKQSSPKLESTINLVKQAWEYALYVYAYKYSPDTRGAIRGNYINDLKVKAASLQSGEKVLIPLGPPDHAIALELACVVNGRERTYDVKVYNSGQGIENHNFWLEFNMWGRVPTLEFLGVRGNAIEQSALFQRLIDVQLGRSSEDVYDIFTEFFVRQGQGRKQQAGERHHQQATFSNACSSKCYNFWLQEMLGKTEYYDFKLSRTQFSIKRLNDYKDVEKTFCGERRFVSPNFFTRILYFLFNFISIDAQIALAEKTLKKRHRKFVVLSAPAA